MVISRKPLIPSASLQHPRAQNTRTTEHTPGRQNLDQLHDAHGLPVAQNAEPSSQNPHQHDRDELEEHPGQALTFLGEPEYSLQGQTSSEGGEEEQQEPAESGTTTPSPVDQRQSSTIPKRMPRAGIPMPKTKTGLARRDTAEDVSFLPDLDIATEVRTAVRDATSFTDFKPNELAAIIPSRPGIALDHHAVKSYLLLHDFALEQGLREGEARVFRVPLVRLEREAGFTANHRATLRKALRKLVTAPVEWNTPRATSSNEVVLWEVSAMLSHIKFIYDKNHTVVVEWAYSDPLREKLRLVGNYFRMRLKSLRETRTYGGWALYLYLSRYRTFVGARTDSKYWRDWVPILTGKHLDDFEQGQSENVGNSWRYFNRDVVRKAVAEVNSIQSDYEAAVRFSKVGARVSEVYFDLIPRNQLISAQSIQKDSDAQIIDRLVALSFKERDAAKMLQINKADDVLKALGYVEHRLASKTGRKIINTKSYMRTMLDKVVSGEFELQLPIAAEAAPGAAGAAATSKKPETADQLAKNLRELLESWAKAEITATLDKGLDNDQAKELVQMFIEEKLPTMHEQSQKSWKKLGLANEVLKGDIVSWLANRIHPIPDDNGQLMLLAIQRNLLQFPA